MTELSIQQTAKKTGLSTDTLRYYERIGLLRPNRDASSRHRRYTQTDLAWIQFLNHLRSTGMPLSEIRDYLALFLQGDQTLAMRLTMLEAHAKQVEQQIADLQANLVAIRHKIAHSKECTTKPTTETES